MHKKKYGPYHAQLARLLLGSTDKRSTLSKLPREIIEIIKWNLFNLS